MISNENIFGFVVDQDEHYSHEQEVVIVSKMNLCTVSKNIIHIDGVEYPNIIHNINVNQCF